MGGDAKCPFCRVPVPTSDEEMIERYKKRIKMDDAVAMYCLGCCYNEGKRRLPQNYDKALEHWHQAGELGNAESYYNTGCSYDIGDGVEHNTAKAKHYWELAATRGNEVARFNLGIIEGRSGNLSIALKHYMIAVGFGQGNSLKKIREFYVNGHATKDDYGKALRAYQKYIDGIKSDQRDKAAAHNSMYRYY